MGFSFGSCLSVSCDGISNVMLLRGVVFLCFCQMTENPSGLAERREVKVGRQAFCVMELVNFVLGRISLVCFCSTFDSYYKGDPVNSSSVLSPYVLVLVISHFEKRRLTVYFQYMNPLKSFGQRISCCVMLSHGTSKLKFYLTALMLHEFNSSSLL